jgi:hypothetical protein
MSRFSVKNRCEICEVGFKRPYLLERHLATRKHQTRLLGEKNEHQGEKNENRNSDNETDPTRVIMSNNNEYENQKNHRRKKGVIGEKNESTPFTEQYMCEFCDFSCKYASNWSTHMNTAKHMERISIRNLDLSKDYIFQCTGCNQKFNKDYKLKYHKKKCIPITLNTFQDETVSNITGPALNEPINSSEMVKLLIKENQELRNFVIEQTKEQTKQTNNIIEMTKTALTHSSGGHHNHTNSHNNNNNHNQFNIQLFLNEKCKDALNLSHFIENIQVTNQDLENNAENGFVKGISKILIENLRQMSLYERPIHCTDLKRETMYVKEEDRWKKEEDTQKLQEAIQEVSRKSLIQYFRWKEENPEHADLDSEIGSKCMAISRNSMAGSNRDEYYNKVIRAVAKETVLEKQI